MTNFFNRPASNNDDDFFRRETVETADGRIEAIREGQQKFASLDPTKVRGFVTVTIQDDDGSDDKIVTTVNFGGSPHDRVSMLASFVESLQRSVRSERDEARAAAPPDPAGQSEPDSDAIGGA